MKKVKKIPNCCSYNSPGFTYSQPFQTDAQMVLDLKLSYEHPPKGRLAFFQGLFCRLSGRYIYDHARNYGHDKIGVMREYSDTALSGHEGYGLGFAVIYHMFACHKV